MDDLAKRNEVLVPVTLIPVEIFGTECDHEAHRGDPVPFSYGLSDAVSSWSDCNRAIGHIYRVDDMPPGSRLPGESITIHVTAEQAEWLKKRWGDG